MVTAANGNTRNNKISIIHHFYCFVTSTEVNPIKGNPLQLFVQKLTLCAHSVLYITKDVKNGNAVYLKYAHIQFTKGYINYSTLTSIICRQWKI